MMIQEKTVDIIKTRKIRDEFVNRIDILNEIKELPITDGLPYSNLSNLSDYFEVGYNMLSRTVDKYIREFSVLERVALSKEGAVDFLSNFEEAISVKVSQHATFENSKKNRIIITNRGSVLFSKNGIVRIAMLLPGGAVASSFREKLIDIISNDAEYNENAQILSEVMELKKIIGLLSCNIDSLLEKIS